MNVEDLPKGAGQSVHDNLESGTVLVVFLCLVIVFIYLVGVLLVVVRRARKLMQLHNRNYYFLIAFYLLTKIVLCVVLGVQLIVGIAGNLVDITAQQIEAMVKTGIVLANLSIIQLFLTSLQFYFHLTLSALHDTLTKKHSKYITAGLQALQILVALTLLIPLVFFDVGVMNYRVLNGLGLGLDLLTVICFMSTFFFLSFKMTGVVMESRMNEVVKRVYKLQLILLVSRAIMIGFELAVAMLVPDTFQQFIKSIDLQYQMVVGMTFIGSILFILLTEGIPVMYSLRSGVVQALSFKSPLDNHKENLEQSLVQKLGDGDFHSRKIRLKHFTRLTDLGMDQDEAIWLIKKGTYQGKQYLIRIPKHEISNYIFQDIENEITLWNELPLKSLSKLSYFCEGDLIHLVQRYYYTTLDARLDSLSSQSERLRVAIQLGEAISELHRSDIVHGCLSPNHIFWQNGQILLNGCGLNSMRKYLCLITGYTNKSMYTAVQHLCDKNNVVLKPQKAADVYSFGLLLYQIITNNRQYRQLSLREVQVKFGSENFRPKLPEGIRAELKNLIRRCWHENAERRPEIDEVVDILRRFL